jgi:3',5'-cyclic AMP phosphodiesterase CpdA
MRTLLHLSDLHFGRVDAALLEPLRAFAHGLAPDCVVVSGDLTQRARPAQFRAARRFLDALPQPQVVVPGNHDVPLYDVVARFLRPLDGYRGHIAENVEPAHVDDEIAVFGMNSARSLTIKGGRVNEGQLAHLKARCAALPEHVVRVVVSHHPFELPHGHADEPVGRAALAMRTFADIGVDLLLAGHLHLSHAGSTAEKVELGDYTAIVVQAGTATSTRGRGEANSFNVIRLDRGAIGVERWEWRASVAAFELAAAQEFERRDRRRTGRTRDRRAARP